MIYYYVRIHKLINITRLPRTNVCCICMFRYQYVLSEFGRHNNLFCYKTNNGIACLYSSTPFQLPQTQFKYIISLDMA